MTRITKDRGALKHDDRLDALSMAVAYWVEQMAVDERKTVADLPADTDMRTTARMAMFRSIDN